jgi:hypothetical protein
LINVPADVDPVYSGYGTDQAKAIRKTTPIELAKISFLAGSMGPKVAAASSFAEATGGFAGIGRMQDAAAILANEAGTIISNFSVGTSVHPDSSVVERAFVEIQPTPYRQAARTAERK